MAIFCSMSSRLIEKRTPIELIHCGAILAIFFRSVGYNLISFKAILFMTLWSLFLRYYFQVMKSIDLIAIEMMLMIFTLACAYKSEKVERALFSSMYKAKKEVYKFKQFITNYLPNQMAIYTVSDNNISYINNAFIKTFNVADHTHASQVFKRCFIQMDSVGKYNSTYFMKNASAELHSHTDNLKEMEEKISLEEFIVKITKRVDLLFEQGAFEFLVVEEKEGFKASSLSHLDMPNRETENKSSHKVSGPSYKKSNFSTKEKSLYEKINKLEEQTHVKDSNLSIPTIRIISNQPKQLSPDNYYEEGNKRYFKIQIFPLQWDDKDAIAIVFADFTQQKIIMDLKVADKNKDLVIATVSHELRTPINGILGFVNIIMKEVTDPIITKYLKDCKNSGLLMLNLVNSILDLGQIKNNKFKLNCTQIKLQDLIQEVRSLFEITCSHKGIKLNTNIAEDVPETLVTDKDRLSQVLINLLGNAMKFTFEGSITINVELEDPYNNRFKFIVTDTGIGIKPEDQENLFRMYGKIEQQDRKINTKGIGLGLTISNSLAKLLDSVYGESIKVNSEVNKGTSFSFIVQNQTEEQDKNNISSLLDFGNSIIEDIKNEELVNTLYSNSQTTYLSPLIKNNIMRTTPRSHKTFREISQGTAGLDSKNLLMDSNSPSVVVDEEASLSNKRITSEKLLIPDNKVFKTPLKALTTVMTQEDNSSEGEKWCLLVDDNPYNLMVASHIMKQKYFKVKTANHGKEALEVAKEHYNAQLKFSIILMDCQMPVMDGYEATGRLKQMMQDGEIGECPIIALTANPRDEEHENLCKEAGMNGHLSKPLQIAELEKELKKIKTMGKEVN